MTRDTPRQLFFHLPLEPGMGREDFLVTESNRAAFGAVTRWPATPDDAHALALIGPPGSGKTHLAEIWRVERDALKCAPADLSVEAVPTLLARGALVLEDMPGPALDETALFHLLNLARQEGAFVLLTATASPAAWPVRLPDLKSRLAALPLATLEPPDDELLRAVLVKLFADRQLRVDEKVISYLLLRMERSLAAASRLVAALDAAALAERRNITRPLAARVLEALFPAGDE
jgi:chromosomal replication initiation ATPase DnaA